MSEATDFIKEIDGKTVEQILEQIAKEDPDVAIGKLTKGVIETLKNKAANEPAEYSDELNKKAGDNAAIQTATNTGVGILASVVAYGIGKAIGCDILKPDDPVSIYIATTIIAVVSAITASIRKRIANKKKFGAKNG